MTQCWKNELLHGLPVSILLFENDREERNDVRQGIFRGTIAMCFSTNAYMV